MLFVDDIIDVFMPYCAFLWDGPKISIHGRLIEIE